MKKRIIGYLVVIMGMFFCSGSWSMAEEDTLLIGLGVGGGSATYKGVDHDINALPMVYFRQGEFYIDGTTVGLSLMNSEELQLNIYGQYSDHGYKASDSNYLSGMKKRKGSIDAGVGGMVITDIGLLSLDIGLDVSSAHGGYHAVFTYAIPLYESETLLIMPSVGVVWQSEKMVDYYYGVKNSEARFGRKAYSPNSAIKGFAGMEFSYHLWEQWDLWMEFQGEYLGDEISNSPLIDKDYQASGSVGVVYRFW